MESKTGAPKLPQAPKNCAGKIRIAAIVNAEDGGASRIGEVVTICGWSRTVRKHGTNFCFVALSDGTTPLNIQVVVDSAISNFDEVLKCGVGCSFRFTGTLIESPAAGQSVELSVKDNAVHSVTVYGTTDQSAYPLAKKQHSKEYLREIAHLRPRTYFIGAVTRVRSQMAMAVHRFFQDRGFLYIHTPIITAADCEGAGEMFQVSTLLDKRPDALPKTKTGDTDFTKDFFSKPAFLTVSGQLDVESFACSLTDVYTFGPTFRAERSHTSRHLAEFWMVEPEIAFCEIEELMQLAEETVKYCVEWALLNCKQELIWLNKNVDNELLQRLQDIVDSAFVRITYTEAVEQLQGHSDRFDVKPEWGGDLGAEHERFLTEQIHKKPVIVYNYPASLKAFYMKANDDGKTVAAMDCLLPRIGELIGGSQREERLDVLEKKIAEKGLPQEPYWWYKELRRYGTIPHSGYGLGFERLLLLVTGVENIRDVIPFPRYPGHADF